MFACQYPLNAPAWPLTLRRRWSASHARIQQLRRGSPRSLGTSVARPRASGHVSAIVSARYAPATMRVSRAPRVRSFGTSDLSAGTGREFVDGDRQDCSGRDGEDRADEPQEAAADQQGDHHGHRADADTLLHDLRHEDVGFELVKNEKVKADFQRERWRLR